MPYEYAWPSLLLLLLMLFLPTSNSSSDSDLARFVGFDRRNLTLFFRRQREQPGPALDATLLRRLGILDSNNDRQLSWDEYTADLRHGLESGAAMRSGSGGGGGDGGDGGGLSGCHRAFAMADTNNDGLLPLDRAHPEMEGGVLPSLAGLVEALDARMMEEIADVELGENDRNRDGKLSTEEHCRVVRGEGGRGEGGGEGSEAGAGAGRGEGEGAAGAGSGSGGAANKAQYAACALSDVNGDGILDNSELRSIYLPGVGDAAAREADLLFTQVDHNRFV